MEGRKFDNLAKTLAKGFSRRQMLKTLGVGAGGSMLAGMGKSVAEAQQDGNSVCAQWCNANFSGADAGECASQATQQSGQCYACGGPMYTLPDAWLDYTRGSATWGIVCDNGAPDYTSSSVRFTLADSSDKAYINTTNYNGMPLSDIWALSYWTYQASNTGAQAVSINIFLELGDGSYDYIVYEPYENNGGTVPTGAWQAWDTMTGVWWEKGLIGGPYFSFSDFVDAHPDAIIAYDGIALNVGSGWTDFDGNVDGLVINGEVWDF